MPGANRPRCLDTSQGKIEMAAFDRNSPRHISRRASLKLLAAATVASAPASWPRTGAQAADGFHKFKLGDFEITVVSDGSITMPLSFMLPATPKEEAFALFAAYGEKPEALTGQVNVTIVRTPDATIVIDSGGGTDFMPTVGKLPENLERAGIAPDSVTHVVFTHAHADHMWGVIDPFDGGSRFPKARHVITGAEFDYWINPDTPSKVPEAMKGVALGSARRLHELANRLDRLKAGVEIASGVALVDTAGHTPGHVSVLLKSGSEQLLVGGDVLGSSVISFERPDWPWGPDADREQGAATRKRTLDMLATEKIPLLGYHFPWPGLARVERKEGAYRYVAG